MKFYETRKEAVAALKTIAPKDRAIAPYVKVVTRVAEDHSKSHNGGDYDRWLNCHLVTPGLYKAKENWSAEWPIENYCHMDGYMVITQGDI